MGGITGVFENKYVAECAVSALVDEGIAQNEISIVSADRPREKFVSRKSEGDNLAAEAGFDGAVVGCVLGGVVAGVSALCNVFFPGLFAVPVVAVLAGVCAGAVVGSLAGALAKEGFAGAEARRYDEAVREGKALIVVHTDSEKKKNIAQSALVRFGATTKAA